MRRVVRAATDGRIWVVRSRISWTRPAMADQFEHDLAAGYVSGVAMLGVLAVLILFVVFWTPTDVVIPAWFVLLLLLILLLLPVLWALQRPWVITADTPDPPETDGEHWEGIVRGVVPAREEMFRIVDDLEAKGYPNEPHGPLTRIVSPGSLRDS
ncbi:MAG: DUF983 domain-containing protein [Pseudonocardiaceae bacterium]|jgi:hypothetical protein|nr:DUF983 domain-containing protein [Pseudonocardia sp.]